MIGILIAAFLALPIFLKNGFILTVLSLLFINSIASLGLNIVTGWAGQISIGHAAFMSIGAYTSALLSSAANLPLYISIPIAAATSGIVGFLIGFPSLRLSGFYLAIMTMGFGVAIEQLFGWMEITGGHIGLKVTKGLGDLGAYYLTFITLVVIYVSFSFILNGRTGRAFKALRENEVVASSFGINVTSYKILSFVLSAVLGGVAGALYAHTVGYIAPSDFGLGKSLELLAMIVIGGLGSIGGCIAGAAIYTALPFFFSRSAISLSIVFGFLLLATVLLFPRGIFYYLNLLYLKYFELPIIWIMRKASKAEGRFVKTPDGMIHFVEKPGKEPTVVLLHGNWGSWKWFKPLLQNWNLDNRVVALDLPGFGHSSKPTREVTLDNYAEYLMNFLKALGIIKPVIVAHSMGSSIALKMVHKHPESASALIFLSPSPIDGYKTPEEIFPLLSLYPSSVTLIKKLVYPVIPDRKLAKEIVKDVANMDRRGFTENARALLENLENIAPDISLPILIIRCNNDPLITTSEYEKTARALRAEEIIFEGCGHNPQIVRVEETLKQIRIFIERKVMEVKA